VIDFKTPPADFDEAAYLAANGDVADAVLKGQLSSGWHHVLLKGYREPRVALPSNVKADVDDYWRGVLSAMPPPALRERVHGSVDEMNFHLVGLQVAEDIDAALARHAPDAASDLSVLDFGCGCGRVVGHVKQRHPRWALAGCDIDAEAIAWCRQRLRMFADFDTNGHWPPVALESAAFDVIYAISVFTHLAEDMQFAWLNELRRLAKPGGLLLLSVHPIALAPQAHAPRAREEGFVYAVGEATKGLPDFYQTSMHSTAYIRDTWSRYFDIVEVMEKRVNNHQDLVVARARRQV
jgi:SAM-dependent methyltransferase